MRRPSRSGSRRAPEAPSASESAPSRERRSGGGAGGAPGNGLLVFFGVIAGIFGFLSTVELLFGGGAGPVFFATLFVCVLMVVLGALYMAGWRWPRRRRATSPARPHSPKDGSPPPAPAWEEDDGGG